MIEDPAILANILIVLFLALVANLSIALVGLIAGAAHRRHMSHRREKRREPETHGDDGGRHASAGNRFRSVGREQARPERDTQTLEGRE